MTTISTLLLRRAELQRALADIDLAIARASATEAADNELVTSNALPPGVSRRSFAERCRSGRVAGARRDGQVWIATAAAWRASSRRPAPTTTQDVDGVANGSPEGAQAPREALADAWLTAAGVRPLDRATRARPHTGALTVCRPRERRQKEADSHSPDIEPGRRIGPEEILPCPSRTA